MNHYKRGIQIFFKLANISSVQRKIFLCRYFVIPHERAFNCVNQDGGRAIKGSAVMGFSLDPQKCLEEAAGDLRHMGCTIYYRQCQEVNTIARQLLLGAPNTIDEEMIKQTLDEELKLVEQKLLSKNIRVVNGEVKEYVVQEDVEKAIQRECEVRFSLAHSAPIMKLLLS